MSKNHQDHQEEKNIQFDEEGNAILTEADMIQLLRRTSWISVITTADSIPNECFLLINAKLREAHLVPANELLEWEKDGSCEPGDHLFKIELAKKY